MNSIRRETMRQLVESQNVVTIEELQKAFPSISLMTLHRDLNYLQEQGFLVKIRGGARYIANASNEPTFSAREIVNRDAKEIIAQKAQQYLEGSSSVFLDAGTSCMALAKKIPDTNLNIITTGPNIALDLVQHTLPVVTLLGGVVNKKNLTVSGTATLEMISSINIDTAFLAASGYQSECGFTCGIEGEAQVKRKVIEKARVLVLLMDSSKLDRVLPYTFAQVEEFQCIITELPPDELPASLQEVAKNKGITLL